jgi:L-rhamnose mutarotase
MEMLLKRHGVSNYSIIHERQSHPLFGYAEIENELIVHVGQMAALGT